MLQRPLFLVALAFGAGIILAGVAKLPIAVALAVLAFGGLCAASRRAHTIALLFAVAAVGMLRYQVHTIISPDDVSRFIKSHSSAVVGRVDSDIDVRADRAFLPIAVNAIEVKRRLIPATGRMMAVYYRPKGVPDWHPPEYGSVIVIRGRISKPGGASNPGGFSWADYLARQKMYAVSYIRSPKQIEILPKREANPFVALAIKTKKYLESSILSSMPRDEGSVVAGMVLGTYSALPDRLMSNFQKTGTLHLLAASGFNCAILVVIFGFLLSKLGLSKKWANPALMAILIFYLLIVGAKPSIVRATVMAILWLLGKILKRPSDTLNLLFAAAIVILAINPADIFDVGFQLSFAAVLALILVLPVITEAAEKWGLDPTTRKAPRNWATKATRYATNEGWQGITATTAATLGTLPISAQYFNQLSLVSIAVNAIVAATILPIFAIGLVMPITNHIPGLGGGVAWTETMLTRSALSAINWFGELPRSCVYVTSPGITGVTGYYILLSAFLTYAYSKFPTKKRISAS